MLVAYAIASRAEDAVCLVCMAAATHIEGLDRLRGDALEASRRRLEIGKITLGNGACRGCREVADRGEDHLVGGVGARHETLDILRRESRNGALRAEDVVSELRATKYHILEVVVYTLRG